MACTHSSNCQLYPQFAADAALKLWKQHYCEGDFNKCARYQLSLQGKAVPLTLLPNGKQINLDRSKEEVGAHALFNAILKNRPAMVRSILKTNTSKGTITNSDGQTPLMVAAEIGNRDTVTVLLEFGCSPQALDKQGRNPAQIAEEHGFPAIAKQILAYRGGRVANDEPVIGADEEDETGSMPEILGFLRKLNPFK